MIETSVKENWRARRQRWPKCSLANLGDISANADIDAMVLPGLTKVGEQRADSMSGTTTTE